MSDKDVKKVFIKIANSFILITYKNTLIDTFLMINYN